MAPKDIAVERLVGQAGGAPGIGFMVPGGARTSGCAGPPAPPVLPAPAHPGPHPKVPFQHGTGYCTIGTVLNDPATADLQAPAPVLISIMFLKVV